MYGMASYAEISSALFLIVILSVIVVLNQLYICRAPQCM